MTAARVLRIAFKVGALLAIATPAIAGPAMSTTWQTTALDTEACVAHSTAAMTAAGLTGKLEALRESVYGERGQYTAVVRCLTGQGVMFVVVSGPNLNQTRKLMADLASKF